jgi:hypothetical protein
MLHTEDPIHQGSYAPNPTVDRGSTVPSACRPRGENLVHPHPVLLERQRAADEIGPHTRHLLALHRYELVVVLL